MKDMIFDKKLSCCSFMSCMEVNEYLKIVEKVYENKGGIQGQREPLKQKTAITIRKRMIKDITEGAILPPVVIGVIVDEEVYNNLEKKAIDTNEMLRLVSSVDSSNISIIDGMQRTTAIMEAIKEKNDVLQNSIRVEFWISKNINSLLYRMLVLNTGQVPWNIRRQIEIVFGGVINAIKQNTTNINIMEVDDKARRKKGGEYNANELIEMFLAFGARTWKTETKEKLTDEFTRGDFVQTSSEIDAVEYFCKILNIMSKIDISLDSKYGKELAQEGKFSIGRDLFSSLPAKIGFSAACGMAIFGRPGVNRNSDEIVKKAKEVEEALSNVLSRINSIEGESIVEYVDFETLSELTSKKSSKIGDFERDLFFNAFRTMIEENGRMDALTECWRSA